MTVSWWIDATSCLDIDPRLLPRFEPDRDTLVIGDFIAVGGGQFSVGHPEHLARYLVSRVVARYNDGMKLLAAFAKDFGVGDLDHLPAVAGHGVFVSIQKASERFKLDTFKLKRPIREQQYMRFS